MKRLNYVLLTLSIILLSCTGSDVRFVKPQPEALQELSLIPTKFQGTFLIDNDTIVINDNTISGDTINSSDLVVKSWGNYLFVNSLEKGVYKLGCGKLLNNWGNEEIFLEYFVIGDDLVNSISDELSINEQEELFYQKVNKLISDKSKPIVMIDSTDYHFICDNVSVNQFQELLNNAKSIGVTRIK